MNIVVILKKWKTAFNFYGVLLIPTLTFLLLFLIIPMLFLFMMSFRDVDSFLNLLSSYSFSQYVEVFTNTVYLKTIGYTLWIATITTTICMIVAYPAAYMLVETERKTIKTFLYVLLISPLLISVVVRTFAWIVLLAQNGLINKMLLFFQFTNQPLSLLWNINAVVIAYVQVMLPFAVLPLVTALNEINPRLRLASMSLGAGRVYTFWKIIFPLTIPGMIAGAVIIFSLSAGSYITPMLIGGSRQSLLPLAIYQQVIQIANLPLAAALSFTLLFFVFAVVFSLGIFLKRWERKVYG